MANKKNTRRALFMSVMSLILCCAMLMGTTFAWFTDSVTSTNNIIQSGNLDIELEYKKADGSWEAVTATTELLDDTTLWEPGHTEVVYLRISNKGTLALKYKLGLNVVNETVGTNVNGETFALSNYIKFDVLEGSYSFTDRAAAVAAATEAKSIYTTFENPDYEDGSMTKGAAPQEMALVVYMPETVGNEANHKTGTVAPSIQLGVSLVATQLENESDSFGPDYDENATMPQSGVGTAPAPEAGISAVEITVRNSATNAKVATLRIPADAVAEDAENINVKITPTTLDPNVTISADQNAQTYDVEVTGIKEGNTAPIKVELRVGTGLSNVKIFHKGTEILPVTYVSETGYAIFETTSFSPYTVVFDAETQPPVTPPEGSELPKAIVHEYTEDELKAANEELVWNDGYGIYPASLNQKLDCMYKFTAPHDSTTVDASGYANWACDFYVSIELADGKTPSDGMLPENVLVLGGNYGDFGWIGFNNPAVEIGTEIPLLGSVVTNDWTYAGIVNLVQEFVCGVARADGYTGDLLNDATFTVKLCLTNPETNERTAVNTITYTFPTVVYDGNELQDAINNGSTNIELGGDIDLSQGIVIP